MKSTTIKQQGYALIVLMISMLGIGAGLLGGAPVYWQLQGERQQREVLANAKSALVSYAVSYIDFYGARGAGLGHLPCPDTDVLDTSWRYDGPNPPCGAGLLSTGKLPRHLASNKGRFSFHQQDSQQLLYSVSTRFVNNPINRSVNPETKSDIQAFSNPDVMARISFPHGASYSGLSVEITHSDINNEMLRRAASWVISRLPTNPLQEYYAILEECPLTAKMGILLWISGEHLHGNNCDVLEHSLNDAAILLEGVPYQTHWFFRNEWYNYVTVEWLDPCSIESVNQCDWNVAYASDKDRARIQLAPTLDVVSQ